MKHLAALNKYFVKYKWRLLLGLLFVTTSNLFTVIQPAVVRKVIDRVVDNVKLHVPVSNWFIISSGLFLLGLAVIDRKSVV